jgi:hypothetical protein
VERRTDRSGDREVWKRQTEMRSGTGASGAWLLGTRRAAATVRELRV